MKKLCWLVPGIFTVYVTLSCFLLHFFGTQLPVWLTNILSVTFVIFLPLFPLFDKLGLLEEQMWRIPNYYGMALGVVIYDVVLFFIFRKRKASKN